MVMLIAIRQGAAMGIITRENVWVNVQPLEPTGIVFEPIGRAFMYQESWTVVTKISLNDWRKNIDFVEESNQNIVKLCEAFNKTLAGKCQNWQREVEQLVEEIKEEGRELEFFTYKGANLRQKRGIINAVGSISKFLFGTMDHEDANKIYERMFSLEKHDEQNLKLNEKQISVVKSSFEALQKPITNLNEQQKVMETRVESLINEVRDLDFSIKEDLRILNAQVQINALVAYLILKLHQIQKHQSDLLQIINTVHQHKLHPLVLNSRDLTELRRNITHLRGKNNLFTDFSIMNQIITARGLQLPEALIVKIDIPISPYQRKKPTK